MTIPRDRYTQAVLTVIALCLLFQCAMSIGPRVEAHAAGQPAVQAVVVVGWGDMQPNGQIHMAPPQTPYPVAIAAPQAVPVVVNAPPQPIPVAITSIQHLAGSWDPVNTRAEPPAPGAMPGFPPRP